MNFRIGLWAYLDRYWIDEKIIISQKLDMKPDFVFKSVQNVKYSVIGFGSLFDGGKVREAMRGNVLIPFSNSQF